MRGSLGGTIGRGLALDRIDIHARGAAELLVDLAHFLVALGLLGAKAILQLLVLDIGADDLGVGAVSRPRGDVIDIGRRRQPARLFLPHHREYPDCAGERERREQRPESGNGHRLQ